MWVNIYFSAAWAIILSEKILAIFLILQEKIFIFSSELYSGTLKTSS